MLHRDVAGTGRRLVLAHGFTQTGRSWGAFGSLLAAGRQMVRVDLPGHGGSSTVRGDLHRAGALVLQAGGAAAEGPVDLLGYSLGARVALHAALDDPAALRRLVLIGVTPGIEDAGAREARRRRDDATAEAIERDGSVGPFLSRWLAAPMFAGLPDPGLEERLENTAAGLASSLRSAGTGTQDPLWDRLAALHVPTLLLAGADDLRFAHTAARMSREMPNAVLSLVPGAGHAAHLAQPALTARIVARFLDS